LRRSVLLVNNIRFYKNGASLSHYHRFLSSQGEIGRIRL
jgi:hypothetical protein